jgi:ribosomal-protein-alanine N-acetyltransferase
MRFVDMERFPEFPELRTRRLILREMTLGDLEFYYYHFSDPQIVDSCCHPGPATLEDAKHELERYCIHPFRENRGIRWGIACKSTEKLIGTVGFYDWDKSVRKVEVGYDLTPRYWGRGLMTEALRAVLRFCFSTLQLHRIQAIIDVDNHRSIDLAQRLGFIKEGVLRHNSLFNGKYRDDVCFSLLIEDWRSGTG